MTPALPSVLWVTAEIPDRDLGGGSIRQANLLEGVASALPTDLLVVGSLREERLRRALRTVTELPSPEPWRPPTGPMARRVRELALAVGGRSTFDAIAERRQREALDSALASTSREYDVVLVEHETMAPLVGRRRGERWVLTFHNIESQRSAQTAAVAPGRRQKFVWERDAARGRRLEAWALRTYDAVISMSDADAHVLPGPSVVVPNGVDTSRFVPTPLPATPTIAMTASLNFPPNADGAVWLCREVLPLVHARVPDARVCIAGRDPLPEVRALVGSGVEVVANPADMLPVLQSNRVAVVPLRVGSGTRLKALEAMACGRPVVGTSTGLDGLGIVDGVHARVADDAAAFAEAVLDLLGSDATANALVAPARALAEEFDWRHSVERLTDLIEQLARSAR